MMPKPIHPRTAAAMLMFIEATDNTMTDLDELFCVVLERARRLHGGAGTRVELDRAQQVWGERMMAWQDKRNSL